MAGCDAEPSGSASPATSSETTPDRVVVAERAAPGLDTTASFVKAGGRKYVELGFGRNVTFEQFRQLEHRARLRRFGRLGPALWTRLQALEPDERVQAMVYLKLPASVVADARNLSHGGGDEGRLEAFRRVSAAVAAGRAELDETLRALHVEVKSVGKGIPALYVIATREALEALSRDTRLTLITGADSHRAHPHHGGTPPGYTPAQVERSALFEGFNFNGNIAGEQDIGFIEANVRYAIRESHQHFGAVDDISYHEAPQECDTLDDCDIARGYGSSIDVCDDVGLGYDSCVSAHATAVASAGCLVEGGDPFAAAGAHLWFANRGVKEAMPPFGFEGPRVACFRPGTIDAYRYFVESGVPIVNESWGCDEVPGTFAAPEEREGIVQDHYA